MLIRLDKAISYIPYKCANNLTKKNTTCTAIIIKKHIFMLKIIVNAITILYYYLHTNFFTAHKNLGTFITTAHK